MDGTDGLLKRRVSGQRYHIAGSADTSTSQDTLRYAHQLVANLTSSLVSNGGTIVIQLGEEPLIGGATLSKLFDWTTLEQVVRVASKGTLSKKSIQGALCIAVGFSDWRERIPPSRAQLVQKAADDGVLEIVQLPQSLDIGGLLRERQAYYGDILVTLGGGPGVQHLSELYRHMHRPIIPLDLPFTSGETSASERLNVEAMETPSAFFEYEPSIRGTAALSNLSLKRLPKVEDFTKRFLDFVANLRAPQAFFAHLLNRRLTDYQTVTNFFEQVVSPVVAESGFSRFDPRKDVSEESFLNVEIFKMMEASSLVVVDLTKLRPNCLMELGFALGQGKKTVVTAVEGTRLPFDADALPCHFWRTGVRNEFRRNAFKEFVTRNINRRRI